MINIYINEGNKYIYIFVFNVLFNYILLYRTNYLFQHYKLEDQFDLLLFFFIHIGFCYRNLYKD